MKLTKNNFCPNVRNESTALRICYVCSKTNKICPRVDYTSGVALPDKTFIKSKCPLLNEETIKEETIKEEKVEKSIDKVISKDKVENVYPKSKPKTNNRKKKTTNNRK